MQCKMRKTWLTLTFPILLYIAITLPVPRAITKGGVGGRREEGKEEEEEERMGRGKGENKIVFFSPRK